MNRLNAYSLMAALLAVATLIPAAVAEPQPLLPDGKARPARAAVLLLGGALSDGVAASVQKQWEDTVTLYRTDTPPARSADDVTAFLQNKENAAIRNGKWHAVVVAAPEPAPTVNQAIQKFWAQDKLEMVWLGADEAGDAAKVLPRLRDALLRHSPPWAELPANETRDPARLLTEDSLLADPDSLPVASGRTATVFRAEAGEWQFNLHSFIAHHDGKFWAIWSSGRVNEDSSSQFIRYATSPDGLSWSESAVLAPDPDGEDGPLRWLASGLYVEDGRLYALGCLNRGSDKKGRIWADAQLIRLRWTGAGWEDEGVFADDCMVYFPPMKVAGRDFFVWRDERAHFFTARSLPGQAQWEVKKHPHFPPDYRMSETSAYADPEGVLHLIIRDQGKTKRIYHSLSYDQGDSWTLPVKTNYPDAVSKNFSGRLSNGWYYLINNPKTSGLRDPLTISFSRDGWTFSAPKILRRDSPIRRYPGGAKPERSFQYADAMEHDGRLWVLYATNKEDIEISAFPLADLIPE